MAKGFTYEAYKINQLRKRLCQWSVEEDAGCYFNHMSLQDMYPSMEEKKELLKLIAFDVQSLGYKWEADKIKQAVDEAFKMIERAVEIAQSVLDKETGIS